MVSINRTVNSWLLVSMLETVQRLSAIKVELDLEVVIGRQNKKKFLDPFLNCRRKQHVIKILSSLVSFIFTKLL